MKRTGGIIENWFLDQTTFPGCTVVRGQLFEDDCWREGTYIRTSQVVEIAPDFSKVETMNTVYRLGKKIVKIEEHGIDTAY